MATVTWASKSFEVEIDSNHPGLIFPSRDAPVDEKKTLGCSAGHIQIGELGPPTLVLPIWYEGDSDPFNTFYNLRGTTSAITGMPTWNGGTQTLSDYTLVDVQPAQLGNGNNTGYLGATAKAILTLTLKKLT